MGISLGKEPWSHWYTPCNFFFVGEIIKQTNKIKWHPSIINHQELSIINKDPKLIRAAAIPPLESLEKCPLH
jgi:hypothetical protein